MLQITTLYFLKALSLNSLVGFSTCYFYVAVEMIYIPVLESTVLSVCANKRVHPHKTHRHKYMCTPPF